MAKRNKVVNKTRRGNNEGSIFQRNDGRWVGIASVGYDSHGKVIRKSVYGKSRMEVAQKLTELTNRIDNENYDYVNKNNVGKLMTEWLLIFKKSQVSPRTFEGIFRNYKLHIEPRVGNMKLDEVNSIVIQKVLNGMLDNNYSLAVVKKVKFIFNQFFNYAIDNKMIATNPTTRTRVKSSERKIYDSENRYKAIPPEDRNRFLQALNNHKFIKPLCMCMMFAGLRTGETLGLLWKDVDLNKKIIKVKQAITTIPKFDENGKVKERVTVVSDTKTACSVREVPMPDVLVEAMKDYKCEQEINGAEHNTNLTSDNCLVFANYDGSVRSYSGTKKIFYRFLEKYGLDNLGIHFHGLRHTYSNMLFEADQNPKVIQALLGHKSVKTTITTYNSVDKSYFQKATDTLNKQFRTTEKSKEKDNAKQLLQDFDDEELDELVKLLEKRKRRKQSDIEM